jgi:hypothetical protein
VLVTEGIVGEQDVTDVPGAALAALNRAAARYGAAAEARADDDHEERLQVFGGERRGGHAAPVEPPAADRVLAERRGLPIADIADVDPRVLVAQRDFERAADGEIIPEIAVEVRRREQDAVLGRGAGGCDADSANVGERRIEACHRVARGGDDRGDRALRALFGGSGELLGNVDHLVLVVADRERAGGSADVDANVVGHGRYCRERWAIGKARPLAGMR